jgi:hypothetical protein
MGRHRVSLRPRPHRYPDREQLRRGADHARTACGSSPASAARPSRSSASSASGRPRLPDLGGGQQSCRRCMRGPKARHQDPLRDVAEELMHDNRGSRRAGAPPGQGFDLEAGRGPRCGGFEANAEMRPAISPQLGISPRSAQPLHTGNGQRMASAIGPPRLATGPAPMPCNGT